MKINVGEGKEGERERKRERERGRRRMETLCAWGKGEKYFKEIHFIFLQFSEVEDNENSVYFCLGLSQRCLKLHHDGWCLSNPPLPPTP
jgi:hypothetical protein